MLVVDSQVHLFSPAQPGETKRSGARLISLEQLVEEMKDAGVDRVVIVPPRPDEKATNEYALEQVRRWPDKFGVMGKLLLDRPDARAAARAWKGSGLLGYRVSFPPGQQTWLADRSVDWLWQAAEEFGFPVMVWAPKQLTELAETARRFPRAPLVIDHLGTSPSDRDEQVGAVVKELMRLAPLENVAVKASGLPNHTTQPFPFSNLHPYVRDVVAAFGPERVFWGTDLTFISCTYREAVRMFTEEMPFLAGRALDEVMGAALVRWLRW